MTVKKYDKWLIWDFDGFCNLNCEYCNESKASDGTARKIDTSSLLKALKGNTYRINFSGGGEPFLIDNFIDACKSITADHFISMNTNLTSVKVREFAENIKPERVVEICASLHYKELVKKGLLERYISNFILLKKKGFPVAAKCVAHPSLMHAAKKIRMHFKERGIYVIFEAFNGTWNGRRYPHSYTGKEKETFGFPKDYLEGFFNKGKLCNAGFNAGFIHKNGNVTYCMGIEKSIGNIYGKIRFEDTDILCPLEFCSCPLKNYDIRLFKASKFPKSKMINGKFGRIKEFLGLPSL